MRKNKGDNEMTKKATGEVWAVEIGSLEYANDNYSYHVIASSVSEAESIGLSIAKKEEVIKPFCRLVEFLFELDS